ncbi:MAG: triose-phosphate isomerase, partial [Candidatus Omnitrophica bacterium]|nr:triose-phosphate isomerase [Candidatus Omnitrophota bacterium]
RRQFFGETDEHVQRKVVAALRHGLTPILCVGETLPQREAGRTMDLVRQQLKQALAGLSADDLQRVVIAYEPVWAIGTGRNATPTQAQEVHATIRQCLKEWWTAHVAEGVRLQYGGSVNAANALELLQQPDVDGALVGGASLKAEAFTAIVHAAVEAKALQHDKQSILHKS